MLVRYIVGYVNPIQENVYFCRMSIFFHRLVVQSLFKRFYPQINLHLSFKNYFSIGSLFSHKDKIPSSMRSNMVYSYNYNQCSDSYYGETSCHLRTCIAEHRGLSYLTGILLTSPPHSNIRDHALLIGHDISTNSFKIIFSTNSQS